MRNQVPKMYESSAHWKTTSSRYGSFHSNGVTSSSTSRRFGSPTSASHFSSSSSSGAAAAAHANASPGARTTRFLPSVPPTAAGPRHSSSSSSTSSASRAASLSMASDPRCRYAAQKTPSRNRPNDDGNDKDRINKKRNVEKQGKKYNSNANNRGNEKKCDDDDSDRPSSTRGGRSSTKMSAETGAKPSTTRSNKGMEKNDEYDKDDRSTASRYPTKSERVDGWKDDRAKGRTDGRDRYPRPPAEMNGRIVAKGEKEVKDSLNSGDVLRRRIAKGGSSSSRPLAVGSSNQDNGTTRVRRTTTGSADVGGSPTTKTSILRGDHSITKPISSFNGNNARFSPSSSRGVAVGSVSSTSGVVTDSNGLDATTSSGSPTTGLGRTRSFSDLTERFGDKLRLNENNGDGYQRTTKAPEAVRGVGGAGIVSLRRDSTSDFDAGLKNGVKNDTNNSVYAEGASVKRPTAASNPSTTSTRSSPQREARSLGRTSSKDLVDASSSSSASSSSVAAAAVSATGKSTTPTTRVGGASVAASSPAAASTVAANASSNSIRHPLENSGLRGLRNLGNTCFMNSVIQCLSNTRQLLEYALNQNYANDVNKSISSMKGQLITAFAHLLQDLWKSTSSENYLSPSAFKSAVAKFAPRFTGYAQQDAQEFLRYLLQGLAEDVNRVTSKPKPITVNDEEEDKLSDLEKASLSWKRYLRYEDSRIGEIFVGQLKSTLKCTTCGYASVTFDPFWDLSLPLPKSPLGGGGGGNSIHACVSLFTKEEILDGDERPKCSRCKQRRRCTKSFSIQKFPRILVLHLKRFATGGSFRAKLSTLIDFPHALDLSDFAADSSTAAGTSATKPVYNLYAVSNHSGSTHSGHYTAYCKHPYSGTWHYYNDSRVSKHSKSGVCSAEGYVLFYEHVGAGGVG